MEKTLESRQLNSMQFHVTKGEITKKSHPIIKTNKYGKDSKGTRKLKRYGICKRKDT